MMMMMTKERVRGNEMSEGRLKAAGRPYLGGLELHVDDDALAPAVQLSGRGFTAKV